MNEEIIVKFNNKIYYGFVFSLLLFISGLLMTVFTIEDDPKHSAIFYEFVGIYLQLISLPFLISYGKHIFQKKKAFYFNEDFFIYNNPLVDVPNPIFWKEISDIKEIKLGNIHFIAISFHNNLEYINKLNPFWRYMANFRLKKFKCPLMINQNDMININFQELIRIFYNKFENYKVSNKTLERNSLP